MTADPGGQARPGIWRRPVLRTDEDQGRHRTVSWLELFVDLAFVVVVSRVAEHLAEEVGDHLGVAVLVGFAIQFLAVFWVWNGFTYYTERFESDGVEARLLGFASVVPVAGLAVFGGNGLTEGFVGFVISYVLARLLNIGCWTWASVHCPEFRPVAARFVAGFLVAAVLITVGLVLGPPLGIVLFLIAVLVEIAAPATTVRRQAALPALSTSRFPERFGQFTIIVLGEGVLETIVALSTLSSREQLGGEAITLGLLGLGITFALCWIYFDFVARRAARGAFLAGLLWVYLHMSVLVGITLTGVGASVAIIGSPSGEFGTATRWVLIAGVVLTLLAVASLQPTLAVAPRSRSAVWVCLATAVVLALLGVLALGVVAQFAVLLVGLAVPVVYGTYRSSIASS